MTAQTALLEVRDLRSGYGRVEVLRGVSLSVGAGELVALLGSNGAGKTTFNNTVCGLVPAWEGDVVFEGPKDQWAQPARYCSVGDDSGTGGTKDIPQSERD